MVSAAELFPRAIPITSKANLIKNIGARCAFDRTKGKYLRYSQTSKLRNIGLMNSYKAYERNPTTRPAFSPTILMHSRGKKPTQRDFGKNFTNRISIN